MTKPSRHGDWARAGVKPVLDVADAVALSGIELNSLTRVDVSWRLFGEYTDRYNEALDDPVNRGLGDEFFTTVRHYTAQDPMNLTNLLRPLRRLRLFVHMLPTAVDPKLITRVARECKDVFDVGLVKVILREAKELRVLKIQFPNYDYWLNFGREEPTNLFGVDLRYALGVTTTFPHLYELALSECRADPDTLFHFLLRHKTLRRLSLSNMRLVRLRGCNWWSVLTWIAGRLPNLKRVQLRGVFETPNEINIKLDDPGKAPCTICPLRDALEMFIITGEGNLQEILQMSPVAYYYNGEPEGYPETGLPDDDPPLDNPASLYDVDEFDHRF